jgi:nitroreductase
MKEIFARRSIRKFTEEPVSDAHLEKLLRAAMNAPSACNEQPWEFVVLKNRDTFQQIRAFQRFSMPLDTAALAIVVCGDTTRQKFDGFWVQDCSAATQNLLLEAEHLGLGAVWMGLHPIAHWTKKMTELLGLPEKVVPLGVIAVGHPAARVEPADRYLPERVHFEKW